MKTLSTILFVMFAAAFAFGQTETPPPSGLVGSIFLARDDGNGNPGEEVKSFFTTDIPIHCVVELDSQKKAVVKMVFVAVAVDGVKRDANVVTTTYTTKGNENQVNFTGKPYNRWHPGKYRVDIFVDGKLATDLAFEIRPASGSVDGAAFFQPKKKPVAKPPVRQKP